MKTLSCLPRLLSAIPVAVSLLLAPALMATPLLTAAYEAQLEAWLGQGDLDFTNIYTKQADDDSFDFHAAADWKGATFTLMSLSGAVPDGQLPLPSQIIGGYNPQSWNSTDGPHISSADAERTAFLYNLSAEGGPIIQRQNLNDEGETHSGRVQTHNNPLHGPVFGGGPDLYVDFDLSYGWSYNYSYGGSSNGDGIGPRYPYGTYSAFNVGALEVWTFAPTASTVPDTSGILGLLGVSLLALVASRRRVVRRSDHGVRP